MKEKRKENKGHLDLCVFLPSFAAPIYHRVIDKAFPTPRYTLPSHIVSTSHFHISFHRDCVDNYRFGLSLIAFGPSHLLHLAFVFPFLFHYSSLLLYLRR